MNKWSAQHYNALAKEIRELFPNEQHQYEPIDEPSRIMTKRMFVEQRAILTTLALNLAHRFKEDNEQFDPVKFLDQCSPDIDLYPLSELWEADE